MRQAQPLCGTDSSPVPGHDVSGPCRLKYFVFTLAGAAGYFESLKPACRHGLCYLLPGGDCRHRSDHRFPDPPGIAHRHSHPAGCLLTWEEDENHSVPPPSPIEAIRFVMEQKGLKNADLIAQSEQVWQAGKARLQMKARRVCFVSGRFVSWVKA